MNDEFLAAMREQLICTLQRLTAAQSAADIRALVAIRAAELSAQANDHARNLRQLCNAAARVLVDYGWSWADLKAMVPYADRTRDEEENYTLFGSEVPL